VRHFARRKGEVKGPMDVECAADIDTLLHGLEAEGVPDFRLTVMRTRLVKVLDVAERGADRAEFWDTAMFLTGFMGSLVVTIATAVNLAGYVSPSAANAVSTAILLLSSIGTAAMGLRERLKFKEVAVLSRRTASQLQRAAFLYLAGAETGPNPDAAFRAFVHQVERIKQVADAGHLQLRDAEDSGGGLATRAFSPGAVAVPGAGPGAGAVVGSGVGVGVVNHDRSELNAGVRVEDTAPSTPQSVIREHVETV
jgi:hypothetical protein